MRHIRVIGLLAVAAAAFLLAGIILHPLFLLAFAAVFACNLFFHLGNKLDMSLYTFPAQQLSKALRVGRALAGEGVPGTDAARDALRRVGEVERRSRIVGQGDGGNELTAIFYLVVELVKIAFNAEVLLFHRFMGSITARRNAIHALLRFIGETNAALSVMRLRAETATCRPRFVEGKRLLAAEVVHPLIPDCVPNTLRLAGTGLLLTGSNMSGKTTFIRTLTLNALLARLNRGGHVVLCATHDIELAELLRADGYELHHFREEVSGGELVFDYRLHTGPLSTRNAIRILELCGYPEELVAEALDVQQRLMVRAE